MRKSPTHNSRSKKGNEGSDSKPKKTTQGHSRNSRMKVGRKRYRGQGK